MSWKLFSDPTVKLYIVLFPVLEFKNHNSQFSLLFLCNFSADNRYKPWDKKNGTEVTEFILLGFAGQHKSWHVFFTVFLVIYVTTLVGNIGMILLIKTDSSLHTPMYFFLQNLAFVDICYTSAITPKMLQNLVETEQSISLIGCTVQLLVYGAFATSDCYILAAMADRKSVV